MDEDKRDESRRLRARMDRRFGPADRDEEIDRIGLETDLHQLYSNDGSIRVELFDLVRRVEALEVAEARRGRPKLVISFWRWGVGYLLYSILMFLFFYDIRQMLGISYITAIIICLIVLPVAGWFLVTGMGVVRTSTNDPTYVRDGYINGDD